MMDHGQPPDQKRQRLGSWSNNHSQDRPQQDRPHPNHPHQDRPILPPPRQYPHEGGSPFSGIGPGPDNPLNNPRRHSDQQLPYEPDPRRPTSGPHSAPPHGYLPHPTQSAPPYVQSPVTMKRDPEEQIQQYRPPSRGNGPDHSVGAPHSYTHIPSFEGQGPPPAAIPFRQPGSYPTPHSPMTGNENYHSNYGQPPHQPRIDPYASVTYPPPQGGAPKKKAQRAAQACDSCRNLKAKCDEGRPSCLSCKEKNVACVYRDPPPKQQDKTQTDILDGLMEMRNLFMGHMSKMTEMVEGLAGKVDRIEKQGLKDLPATNLSSNVDIKADEGQDSSQNLQQYPEVGHSEVPRQSLPETPHRQAPSAVPPSPSSASADHGDQGEEEAGEPVKPGPSSIPVNHTTGAAQLLLVGPIAELVSGLDDPRLARYKYQYPMITEMNRGLLRLYGRGQGLDRPPGYEKEPLIDRGAEGTPSDTTSNSEATSPPGEEWGQVGGMTPPPERPDDAPVYRIKHEINSEGMPDLTPATVQELVKSYIANMNIMHPILVPNRLNILVDVFLRSIPESNIKKKPAPESKSAGFLGGPRPIPESRPSVDSPGTKRKRSPAPNPESFEGPNFMNYKPGHPFRSISTAIVLGVLALGKICLHRGRIADVLPEKDHESAWDGSSPATRNGHPRSPVLASPTLPNATGLPSPQEGDRMQSRSRRTSLDVPYPYSATSANARNLDVIPGLPYFAMATDILGNQVGGNSLQHVHANILACLYHGQLGRVMESSSYLSHACRALQIILRPKLERFKRIKETRGKTLVPAEDNPLVFAFWTCLQLESDIVAELDVPMSGILTYEEDMPYPNLDAALADGFERRHIESYNGQLYLRKILNQIHTMFYSPKDVQANESVQKPSLATIDTVQGMLDGVNTAAPSLAWADDDDVSKDILLARLRAKYHGAQVITYRTFVLEILEQSAKHSAKTEFKGVKVSNQFKHGVGAPFINENATRREELPPKYRDYIERGIRALIKSTTAFHGLGEPGRDRLMVTNIWGTAHAQWGNVLTLLAASVDPILKPFVNEAISKAELTKLLRTTLSFLDLYTYRPSALRIDYKILEHVGRKTGLLPPKEIIPRSHYPNLNQSFGSISSGDVPMSDP